MILYNMKDEKLSLVDSKPFAIEKEIQSLVENNTEELFGLRLVGSEFSIDNFRFDSVCFDEESKSLALFALNVDRLSWICQTMSGTVKSL